MEAKILTFRSNVMESRLPRDTHHLVREAKLIGGWVLCSKHWSFTSSEYLLYFGRYRLFLGREGGINLFLFLLPFLSRRERLDNREITWSEAKLRDCICFLFVQTNMEYRGFSSIHGQTWDGMKTLKSECDFLHRKDLPIKIKALHH